VNKAKTAFEGELSEAVLLGTHAARQLENGNWTTKFGDFEDVEHIDLICLEGPRYGRSIVLMRRLR
jgi:hypothetical protein